MLKNHKIRTILGVATVLLLGVGTVGAEDTRHKWQFGFGVSYFATEDDIRSDADLQGCEGVGQNLTCSTIDPRLDKNLLNEATIADDFRFDFTVSYGFTRWFALELGASYFEGEIGPLESFHAFQTFNVFTGLFGPVQEFSSFNKAGEITEIPLQLSALIRFRPHSPFDPYFGFGVGYVFTDLETSDSFDALEARINQLQLTDKNAPFGFDGVVGFDPAPGLPENLQSELGLPKASDWSSSLITDPLVITVNDGTTFHIRGGADYYFTEHFSVYVDGTYTWADPTVEIRVLDQPLGAVTLQESFLEAGVAGFGVDGFQGPWVDSRGLDSAELQMRQNAGLCFMDAARNEIRCQSKFLDACRDAVFSGRNAANVTNQLSECFGEDSNNNFRLDPGEDLNGDGFLERTFGVCVENCDCDPRTDPNCQLNGSREPLWVDDPTSRNKVFDIECFADCQQPVKQMEYLNKVSGLGNFQVALADDPVAQNSFIIQGGDIDLEGFSLGVGVKFTF